MRFALCLILVAFVGVQSALAEDPARDPADQLSQLLPNTTIDGFGPTPIPGLFEVTAGDQIFYFSPTGHLVFGEIWSKDGRSLTAERREEVVAEKIKRLPLQKAVTIGNGPHQVIEFTDPDCPFCRKVDTYFAGRSDVTRHVFFYPLETLHPQAAAKARYILCSEDREKALEEVYAGKWDSVSLPPMANGCQETLLDEHLQLGGMLGVRGTPTIWVDGIRIKGADLAAIAALLDQPSNK
jgi:thiol:disulfide interchange protein DsbC